MKNWVSKISFSIAVTFFLLSCSKVKTCIDLNTGSLIIVNNGSCVHDASVDFYINDDKLATQAFGAAEIYHKIPAGSVDILWIETSTGDTLFEESITIVQCDTLEYVTNEKEVACASDSRLKKDIQPLSNVVESIMKLSTYSYFYDLTISGLHLPQNLQYGFIAQELKNVYPEFVTLNPDGFYSVNYMQMIPILVKGMQEQQSEIDALKKELLSIRQLLENQGMLADK